MSALGQEEAPYTRLKDLQVTNKGICGTKTRREDGPARDLTFAIS